RPRPRPRRLISTSARWPGEGEAGSASALGSHRATSGGGPRPAVRLGAPAHRQARVPAVPPARRRGLAGLARGEPRPRARRLVHLLAGAERAGGALPSAARRGGAVRRVDRLDGPGLRRGPAPPARDAPQAEEQLDAPQPPAGGCARGGGTDDRRRAAGRRGGEGQRVLDPLRQRGGPRRPRRPGVCPRRCARRARGLGRVAALGAQAGAVVAPHRGPARDPRRPHRAGGRRRPRRSTTGLTPGPAEGAHVAVSHPIGKMSGMGGFASSVAERPSITDGLPRLGPHQLLDVARAALAELTGRDLTTLTEHGVLDLAEAAAQVAQLATAAQTAAVAGVDTSRAFQPTGARSAAAWLAWRCRLPRGRANGL